jgi:hypothetical protein
VPGRQRIPRPPEARPGDPAPWFSEGALRTGISVDRVRAAMRAMPPPGTEPALPAELPGGGRSAGVLVALFDEDGEARVILTRRWG